MRRRIAWFGVIGLLALAVPFHGFQRPQGARPRPGSRWIAGTVTDDQGVPLAGVLVQPMRPTYDANGAGSMVTAGVSTTTDAAGRYMLPNLAPEIYSVAVSSGTGRRTRPFATTYYPDITEWRSAKGVNLQSGPAPMIDIVVPMKHMVSISGAIDNASEPDAVVSSFYITEAGDPSDMVWQIPNTSRQPQTSYQIDGLHAGTFDIFPVFARPGEAPRVGHVKLTIPRSIQGLTMEIARGANLEGNIQVRHFDGGRLDLSKLKVGLLARKGANLSPRPVEVNPDGSFSIPLVAEMQYQLSVTGMPANAYIEAANLDNDDVLNSYVNVGRFSHHLDIVLDTAGAEVFGRLVDMRRQFFASNALVVLMPLQRTGNLPAPGYIVIPADRGTFAVRAVAPGDYRVLAWRTPNGRPYFNEDFMKGYLGMGNVIHVYRGARIQAEALVVDTPSQ